MHVTFTLVVILATFGAAAGTCSTTGSGAGTLIKGVEDCGNAAGPALGFGGVGINLNDDDGDSDIAGEISGISLTRSMISPLFTRSSPLLTVIRDCIATTTHHISPALIVICSAGFFVSLNGHAFTKKCFCTGVCEAADTAGNPCTDGSFAIKTMGGGFICVKFGSGGPLPNADNAAANSVVSLTGTFLNVAINDEPEVAYDSGAIATSANGTQLRALLLVKSSPPQAVFFSACGPFVVENDSTMRKRNPEDQISTVQSGFLTLPSIVSGDPHLAGAHGINFDVYGAPGANYSLLVAPAFKVNMQLADRGPEMRFMTAMAVLYKGKSFTIKPWTLKGKRAELIAHFAALGAKVSINAQEWTITIELCAHHAIEFTTHHSASLNYLNFALRVPGCHDAYGGLLGQTYQCKYAHESFEWSREREEAFRVPTLDTPSGSYSPLADCAHEDEYRGEEIRGSSSTSGGSSSTLSMTTMH